MGRTLRDGGRSDDQIEFLEPRDFAFGGDAPADFAGFDLDDAPEPEEGEPRSKWLAGTAGVLIVALVAVGVVAAAPWDGSGGEAVPTSTVAPTTVPPATTTAPSTTVVPVGRSSGSVPGFVFDPLPPGFAVIGAWDTGQASPGTPTDWAELWAAPGATRTTGRWFSLFVGHGWSADARSATRVDLGDGRWGMLEERADGSLSLTAPLEPGTDRSLSIESFGLSLLELVALVRTTVVDDLVEPGAPPVGFIDASLLRDLEQVAAGPSDTDLLRSYIGPSYGSATLYSDGAGEAHIEVDVGLRDERDERLSGLADLALAPAEFAGPLTIPSGLSSASGLPLGQFTLYGDESYAFARWYLDDLKVTVVASVPL
ncbi:MAG: hypothetical protein HZB15_15115, partial [Actinobacteria bacterium]|nr:hypothetical protein [Actinomycetota bacterium]